MLKTNEKKVIYSYINSLFFVRFCRAHHLTANPLIYKVWELKCETPVLINSTGLSGMDENIINVGLDYPDVIGFWDVNELIIVASCFMLFILMQVVLVGVGVSLIVLYGIYKLKDHSQRGKQDHFLWRIGLITHKGLAYFPPPSATHFEE